MSACQYIIAIGSPEAPGFPKLDRVAGDVERIIRLFTNPEQGYQHALGAQLPLGSNARDIEEALCGWFANKDRRESDCVVIYIAGHGEQSARFTDHCLFTEDSDLRRPNTYIRTSNLMRWFFDGEGERPQNVLLILDVCYAGQGTGEALAALAGAELNVLRSGAGLWMIATSDPNTEAGDGAFVDALLEVVEDEAWSDEYLSPYDLVVAINVRFESRKIAQRAVVDSRGTARKKAQFLRSPRFTRELDGLTVADRAHWDVKARGVDHSGGPGWFFTGRRRALRTLVDWLIAEQSDRRARVIVGRPGSGKSAVLGWLVLAAKPGVRAAMEQAGTLHDPTLVPPIGAIAAKIHARGARLNWLFENLAAALGSAARDPSNLVEDLASRTGPIGIIIDLLDEAAEPVEIERELLVPLRACPLVRLIVGTRLRDGRVPLGDHAEILDVDAEPYFSAEDLIDYVFARLTTGDPPPSYGGPSKRVHARRIAEFVARQAGHSFLYARLVSRTLAQARVTVDTDQPGWEARLELPSDLDYAFGSDLDRFEPETRKMFMDLLVPLAYARGKGLPQKNMWCTVASRIAGRQYTNSDLRLLKQKAGYYLVQDTEANEVVYRLFHQTFADYIRHLTKDEAVERSFTEGLLLMLATVPSGVEPWSESDQPYLLNNFASHASAAGMLSTYLKDPGFLLHVSPDALLPELTRAVSTKDYALVRAYRQSAYWLRTGDESSSLAYLTWRALQYGAVEIGRKLQARASGIAWYPEWTASQVLPSHLVLGSIDETISSITTGTDRFGNLIVLTGHRNGAICVWAAATNQKILIPA